MRVLFVGNDREIVKMTGKILQRYGYEMGCAVGIEETIELLQKQYYDLVIADIELIEKDRNDFCQRIRRINPMIRLLLISPNPRDEVPSLYAGADDWIKKPYHMDVLLARISALLRNKHIQEAVLYKEVRL